MPVNDVNILYKRFSGKYQVLPNGCWYWLATKDENGYGRCWFNGKLHKAHRISLFLFKDFDLSSSEVGCHHCDNNSCVNPDHLFPGTHKDNVHDCLSKGRFWTQPNRPRRIYMPELFKQSDDKRPLAGKSHLPGELNPRAKLSESNVRWIRQYYLNPHTASEMGRIFNVYPSTIMKIIRRQRWKHLPEKEANHGCSDTR